MTTSRRLRVFLASPGDVGEERAIARRILAELPDDSRVDWKVVFQVVAWDQPRSGPPLFATMTPQAAIAAGMPKPSECDIVVVILWSRMGTPLPEEFRKSDGTRYRSGTEWEYLEAREAADRTGRPLVLVYRRSEPCEPNPAEPHYAERKSQLDEVEAFLSGFRNPDRSLRGGYREYADPPEFARMFEANLLSIIKAELAQPIGAADGIRAPAAAAQAVPPPSSTTTAVFVGPTERGPLEPQLIIGWDDFVRTYGDGLPADVSYLAHAVRGFFENGGGRTYVVRIVGAGAAAASVQIASASGGTAFGFEAVSVGAWGNRLGVRIRKGTRVGIRISVVEQVVGGERILEDWDNLSLDPTAPNFALHAIANGPRPSQWLRGTMGPIRLDPVADGRTCWLAGGSDGAPPTAEDYLGPWPPEEARTGLRSTCGFEDVMLACIPDHVHERLSAEDREKLALECMALGERLQDRFTLLSVARGHADPESITPVCDSEYAALYAPWVCVEDFGGRGTTWVPAVGHVAGIIARSDLEHGIHHAPVDEAVRGLVRDAAGRSLEFSYDAEQLDTLSRVGVNALAAGEDGTVRTRTAFTTSTNEEHQSLAAQRLVAWIVATIFRGTRWARFEANDAALWRRLSDDISAFLESVWSSGALNGRTPQEAFSVRCDEMTTKQNDVDNGRAVVEVHLALMEPRGFAACPPIVIEAGRSPPPP